MRGNQFLPCNDPLCGPSYDVKEDPSQVLVYDLKSFIL